MHAILLAVATALLQFAPIDTPAGIPAPTFDLHGVADDGTPTADSPSLDGSGVDGRPRVRVSFTSPIEGGCILKQLTREGDKLMAAELDRGQAHEGQTIRLDEPLMTADELRDLGADGDLDSYTIIVACGRYGEGKAAAFSRVYRIAVPAASTSPV